MSPVVPILLFSLAIGVGTTAQTIPQCQKSCQDAVANSTGCTGPAFPCGCDYPYQNAMLQCLAKPSASGGCSYDQIINWTNTIQTECIGLSPPILPPCLTICPLQAQQAANCSSEADTACICGTTYTSIASSCIQQACPDGFQSWNSGQLDFCNGSTPSGPISEGNTATSTSPTGGGSIITGTTSTTQGSTTATFSGATNTRTGTTPANTTSQGSGVEKTLHGHSGLVVVAMAVTLAYGLL